jgi:hypothetical protein
VVRCLVIDLGADIKQAQEDRATPLLIAAQMGGLDVVRCLVFELGADVNQAMASGVTPLIAAAYYKHEGVIKFLVHNGTHVRAVSSIGTAAEVLQAAGGTTEQNAYLEMREHCANPGCEGGGLKRCAVCKETRYCGMLCRVADW